ncbi:MAG: geranylgeranylglyceryl/heptaprenylglyceryl phosphate synthase [Bacteroidales bacterium]|nr:geranylgeranylglyceryl/heptaprenylglyceryl phosphate synthase [Bacteroidales bacterium]
MLYNSLFKSKGKKLAVLIDPGKTDDAKLQNTVIIAQKSGVDFFLVGGSIISQNIDETVEIIKQNSDLPVILFPGSVYQLSDKADAILLLSLISGRNPDFLIGNHVIAAPFLKKSNLEVISVGYILIDGGNKTSVEYMSNTKPIPSDKTDIVAATAVAGEMLGQASVYLEAGSGALIPVSKEIITTVKENIRLPLIVGGGMRNEQNIIDACDAGANIIVIGTAFEKKTELIKGFSEIIRSY